MLPEPWERLLPMTLAPASGESLAGYLLCLAERTMSSPIDIAMRTGLIDHPRRVPLSHALELSDDVAERFASATGTTAQQARALTLACYDGKLFAPVGGTSSTKEQAWRSTAGRTWAWPARTRYCPHCLVESKTETGTPVWRLAWHTAWSFACTRHGCLLSDACASCGTPAGLGGTPPALVPSGAALVPADSCRVATASGICRESFDGDRTRHSAVVLSGDTGRRVLAAQAVLDRLMAWAQAPIAEAATCNSFGRQVAPDQYLRDLRFLAVVHEAAAAATGDWTGPLVSDLARDLPCGPVPAATARTGRRVWAAPPNTAADNALLVTIAVETLALDTVQGEQALAPAVQSGAISSRYAIARVRYTGQPSQQLLDLLGFSNRSALATASLAKSLPDGALPTDLRADTIPALFPAEELAARFAWVPGNTLRTRRVVAVCLRQLATGASIEQAATDLGLAAAATRMTFARVMRELAAPGDLPRFRRDLATLATEWNRTPRPCYAARRNALHDWRLPLADWSEIAADMRRRQGHVSVDWADRVMPASVYVWARATGGEVAYCPLVTSEVLPDNRSEGLLSRMGRMIRGEALRLALDAYADRLAASLDHEALPSN